MFTSFDSVFSIKKKLAGFCRSQLISGSAILFLGSTVTNFGNYFYHLAMGRMLGPDEYGTLVSLLSVIYLISVFSATLNTVVVKFTASFKAKNDYSKIKNMFRKFSQTFFLVGVFLFSVSVITVRPLGHFLNINNDGIIILVNSLLLIRFLVPVNNGLIQGFLNFPFLSLNNVLAVVVKLVIGLVLVKAGMSAMGAVAAVVASDFVTYFVSFLPLKFLFAVKERGVKLDWREKFSYSIPAFLAILGLTSLYTTDLILVKHFLNPYQAGLYSALGILGKIIFFAPSAIVVVMFPMVAENYVGSQKKYRSLFWQAVGLVGAISATIALIYFLFPGLMVHLLYGDSYLEAASLLGPFGVFISLYSLANVFVNFFLSINKPRAAALPFLAAIAQIGLIFCFHKSILQVIQMSILVMALLVIALLLSYLQSEKTEG